VDIVTTEVIITGTGCPVPDADRAGPGVLVRYGETTLQFDAGRATVNRLTAAEVWLPNLSALFVTHHHSDHLTGLQDVVMTRWIMDREDRSTAIPIVAPAGPACGYVEDMLLPWRHDLAVRKEHTGRTRDPAIDLRPFELPDDPTEVWSDRDVRVLAGQVRHEPVHPAVGFRVETPDGAVVISGDTLVCDEMAELSAGADIVIYEALRFEVIERLAEHRRFILDYHADTRLIGAQAAELGVPTLVLTHLIPVPQSEAEKDLFVEDIRRGGFEGDLLVADDLDSVVLSAGQKPMIRRASE